MPTTGQCRVADRTRLYVLAAIDCVGSRQCMSFTTNDGCRLLMPPRAHCTAPGVGMMDPDPRAMEQSILICVHTVWAEGHGAARTLVNGRVRQLVLGGLLGRRHVCIR
jgi:hypothetical protein